jgi:transcriptional regulator with XRE-family HTH domain
MPDQERAICRRLREFRASLELSQTEFCKLAGLNRTAYAGYEYETSQLNYPAAWRIFNAFPELNPRWLAGEKMVPMRDWYLVDYPTPEETGLGPRAAFSQVYELHLRNLLLGARTAWLGYGGLSLFRTSRDASGRVAAKEKFARILGEWLAGRPDSTVNEFLDALLQHGSDLLEKFPRDEGPTVARRLAEMHAIEAKRRLALLAEGRATREDIQRKLLTETATCPKLPPVKSQLETLLATLNCLTKERGKKTELAEFLGVPLASVSRWLSGERDPGGETTLRLLTWVEQQKREQNTLGGAINTTKGKTQSRSSTSHEKTKPSPPKR